MLVFFSDLTLQLIDLSHMIQTAFPKSFVTLNIVVLCSVEGTSHCNFDDLYQMSG